MKSSIKSANYSAKKASSTMQRPELIELSDRIKLVIQSLKVEKKLFAQAGGVTAQSLSGYLAAIREPGATCLAGWIRTFHINGHWLLTGEGEMLGDQGKTETPALPLEELSEKLTPAQREMLTYKRTMQELGAAPERIIDGIEAIAMGRTRGPKSTYATAEPPAAPGYNNIHEPGSDFGKDI